MRLLKYGTIICWHIIAVRFVAGLEEAQPVEELFSSRRQKVRKTGWNGEKKTAKGIISAHYYTVNNLFFNHLTFV